MKLELQDGNSRLCQEDKFLIYCMDDQVVEEENQVQGKNQDAEVLGSH